MAFPLHKFINKRPRPVQLPPPIRWTVAPVTHMPIQHSQTKFETFAQETLTILPRTSKTIVISIGFRLNRGIVFVSLKNELKEKMLSLQDSVISENTERIIVTIQNNSDSEVIINAGDSICFINHS